MSNSIESAYSVIDTFEKHGHYLPNVSKNRNEHKIGDVLLYLKFVHTSGMEIYNKAVDPINKKISYEWVSDCK